MTEMSRRSSELRIRYTASSQETPSPPVPARRNSSLQHQEKLEVKRGRSRRLGVGCRAAAMGLIGAVC
jgi:hypothetical protein